MSIRLIRALAPAMALLAAAPVLLGALDAGAETSERSTHPPHEERPAAALDSDPLPPQPRLPSSRYRTAALAAAVDAAVAEAEAAARTSVPSGTSASGAPVGCAGDFECFKACTLARESGGSYDAVSPGGTYRGAWQFDQRTWDADAEAAGRADLVGQDPAGVAPGDQDAVASTAYQSRGSQPWGGRC